MKAKEVKQTIHKWFDINEMINKQVLENVNCEDENQILNVLPINYYNYVSNSKRVLEKYNPKDSSMIKLPYVNLGMTVVEDIDFVENIKKNDMKATADDSCSYDAIKTSLKQSTSPEEWEKIK